MPGWRIIEGGEARIAAPLRGLRVSRKGYIALIFILSAPVALAQYVVKSGDTLGSIADQFNSNSRIWGKNGLARKIEQANGLKNRDLIFPGMILQIPGLEVAEEVGNRAPATITPVAEEPALSRAPAMAEVAPAQAEDDGRPAILKASFGAGFFNRDLTDTTTGAGGSLKSKGVYSLGLSSLFPFSEESDVEVAVSYRTVSFLKSANRSLSQEQKSFLRTRLGWQWNSGAYSIGGGVQHEQMPLLTGVSASALAVSSFTVFSPYVRGTWGFKRWKKTKADLAFTAFWHFPSENTPYKLESGWSAHLQLPISRDVSPAFSYGFTPFAEFGKRKTNTVKHDDLETGVTADLIWRM
jgi:LysM repeat protein